MEAFLDWISTNAGWVWWSIGALLLVGELALPGIYLLWVGMGAVATGFVAWFVPEFSFLWQCLTFAVFAGIFIFIAYRFFYIDDEADIDNGLTRRAEKHIGEIHTVVNAIENGRGHISVGDTRWLASGPDAPVGAKVRVEAVEGTVMKVVPA